MVLDLSQLHPKDKRRQLIGDAASQQVLANKKDFTVIVARRKLQRVLHTAQPRTGLSFRENLEDCDPRNTGTIAVCELEDILCGLVGSEVCAAR